MTYTCRDWSLRSLGLPHDAFDDRRVKIIDGHPGIDND
jgi:hypothetical protein